MIKIEQAHIVASVVRGHDYMHLLIYFVQFSYPWIACTVMTKLQVMITDYIESIRRADNIMYRLLINGIRSNYKL